MRGFTDHLDISPVQIKQGISVESLQNFDWDTADQAAKVDYLDNFESIRVRNVNYDKPVAVVINPNSGKKIDKIGRISKYL